MYYILFFLYTAQIGVFAITYLIPPLNLTYSSKKNGLVPLTSSTVSTAINLKPNKSVLTAYIRIYLLCLTSIACLFSYFATLNFWHGDFHGGEASFLLASKTLFAYLKLSAALVFPFFFLLQALIQQRRSGRPISDCCISLQSIQQVALYCFLFLNVVPLSELAKLTLGLSNLQHDLVELLVAWGAADAIMPIAVLSILVHMKRAMAMHNIQIPSFKSFLTYGFSMKNREYNLMVSDADFSVDELEGKSDSFVSKLVDVAWHIGNREKAELISNYLVERQKIENPKLWVNTDEQA
ncbi:hypothetical protein BH11CYA1_BH11CYA1_00590 [soil metagenome]